MSRIAGSPNTAHYAFARGLCPHCPFAAWWRGQRGPPLRPTHAGCLQRFAADSVSSDGPARRYPPDDISFPRGPPLRDGWREPLSVNGQ
jgi:hypothetical protein